MLIQIENIEFQDKSYNGIIVQVVVPFVSLFELL